MKNVKTINPINENLTIYLLPGQDICLRLCSPVFLLPNSVNTDYFRLRIKSEYLFLSNINETNDGTAEYTIEQVYNLSNFNSLSRIFLGNIEIILYDENHNIKQTNTLNVIVTLSKKEKSRKITTINPDNNCQIKMYPHELLEVIIFDEKPDIDQCFLIQEDNEYQIKLIRTEEFIFDSPYRKNVSDNFYCTYIMPYVAAKEDNKIKQPTHTIQYHYWFMLENPITIHGKFSGTHLVSTINIGKRKIKVLVNVRNKTKNLTQKINYGELLHEGTNCLINFRKLEENYLCNPVKLDKVVLNNDSYLLVEIPPPHVYYPYFHKDATWNIEFYNNRINVKKDKAELVFQTLKPRKINNVILQRFLVDIRNVNFENNNYKDVFIGSAKIELKSSNINGRIMGKTLDFSIKNNNFKEKPVTYHYYTHVPKSLKYYKVKFKETNIDFDTNSVECESFASYNLYNNIKKTNSQTTEIFTTCINSNTLIYHDPNDRERISLNIENNLIIRMTLPEEKYGKNYENESWKASLHPQHTAALTIITNQIKKIGTKKFQEFHVKPNESAIRQHIQCIKLNALDKIKNLFIIIKHDKQQCNEFIIVKNPPHNTTTYVARNKQLVVILPKMLVTNTPYLTWNPTKIPLWINYIKKVTSDDNEEFTFKISETARKSEFGTLGFEAITAKSKTIKDLFISLTK